MIAKLIIICLYTSVLWQKLCRIIT